MAYYLVPPDTGRHDDFGDNRCVALIRKAGSTSMTHVLTGWVECQDVLHIPMRVAFIREPISRLISCYSFFKELHRRHTQMGPHAPTKSAVSSWQSFVDYKLQNDNQHWRSQVAYLTTASRYVPTHTHRFEDIGTLWQEYFNTRFLPTFNATVHQKVDDYRRGDIIEFYKEDLELWHSL